MQTYLHWHWFIWIFHILSPTLTHTTILSFCLSVCLLALSPPSPSTVCQWCRSVSAETPVCRGWDSSPSAVCQRSCLVLAKNSSCSQKVKRQWTDVRILLLSLFAETPPTRDSSYRRSLSFAPMCLVEPEPTCQDLGFRPEQKQSEREKTELCTVPLLTCCGSLFWMDPV